MEDQPQISITTHMQLVKYAVGADPEIDAPIEVIDGPQKVLTDSEATTFLAQINGGETNGTN